jgi:hypothetical protein
MVKRTLAGNRNPRSKRRRNSIETNVALVDLPTEILQNIANALPTESALDFINVCRSIKIICDDWKCWRLRIHENPDFKDGFSLISKEANDAWKRYAIAVSLLERIKDGVQSGNVLQWLPQLMATNCESENFFFFFFFFYLVL